ncbi:hypothetical protein Bhyg_04744, partial [Pseudolycoriella hygida]
MSTPYFTLLVLLCCGMYSEVKCLRCWDCRSDGINSSFCGDYFDKDLISEQQRTYVYANCSVPESIKNPLAVPKIAVCRVLKQTENFTTIIYRGCHYQEDGLPRDCLHKKYSPGIKTEYCLTCSTDGCNAALDYDLLKKSLLANEAIAVHLSM